MKVENEDVSPELTDADFAAGRPMAEVFPELASSFKKAGRPRAETPKLHIGFRLAADVVNGIRATGKGYNARVEKILRDAFQDGRL